MNAKVALSVAALAAVCGVSQAVFTGSTVTAGSVALLSGGSLTTAGAAVALGGLAILKLGALAVFAASRRGRGKRSALDNEDTVFAIAAQLEPAQCYRRLICDLATGKLPKSDNDLILNLFQQEPRIQDVKFEFATAAKIGKLVKDITACEVRYSCPVSGQEMNEALAQ